MSRSVRLLLSGVELSMRTDANSSYLEALAAKVQEKIEEAKGPTGGRRGSSHHFALLAALSLADELAQLEGEHKKLKKEVRVRSERLVRFLEEGLPAREGQSREPTGVQN